MTRSRATPAGPPVPTIDEQLERMEREVGRPIGRGVGNTEGRTRAGHARGGARPPRACRRPVGRRAVQSGGSDAVQTNGVGDPGASACRFAPIPAFPLEVGLQRLRVVVA